MSKIKDVNTQTTQAFQVGGYIAPNNQPGQVNSQTGTYTLPGTGIAGYQIPSGGPTGYTPYGGAAPYFQPVQFTGPQFQTALQTTNLPTFAETVGSKPGQYDEIRTYVNDAGQIQRIPFKDGQPIYPIPEGYRPQGDQPAAEQPTTTIPVSTTPTNQGDDGGGEGADGTTTTGTLSGYPGQTGLSGLKSAFSNFGSYDLSTPPSENPYGITGSRGFNLGTAMSVLSGNILGAIMSTSSTLSGITPSLGTIGAYGPTPGFTGTLDRATLDAIAYGTGPLDARQMGFSITQEQAINAVAAANVAGLENINGVYGYQKGDAIPGVKDGIMDSKGVGRNVATGALTGHYSDMESFIDRMNMSRADKDIADFNAQQAAVRGQMSKSQARQDARTEARKGKGIGQLGDSTPGDTPSSGSTGKGVASGDYGLGMGPHGDAPSAPDAPSVGVGETGPDTGNDSGATDGGPGTSGGSQGGGHGMGDGTSGGGYDDDEAYCLTEDMKVKRNGVVDFVTKVQVGDIIDNTVVTEVLHKHMREGYYVVNNELKITNDHPVLANGSWKRTEDLVLGDYINNVEVTSLEYVEQVTPTVYIGTAEDRYDVYTEGEVYTVHGQYKNALKKAA